MRNRLAGAQLFVRSLQSAIFLFSSVCGIPSNHSVVPAINTNSLVTIAAELEDGSRIVGQNDISHPSEGSAKEEMLPESYTPVSTSWNVNGAWAPGIQSNSVQSHEKLLSPTGLRPSLAYDSELPSRLQYSHISSEMRPIPFERDGDDEMSVIARTRFDLDHQQDINEGEMSWKTNRTDNSSWERANLTFTKAENGGWPSLPARIRRIIYLNTYGQETFPAPSSAFLSGLATSEVLVFSCG